MDNVNTLVQNSCSSQSVRKILHSCLCHSSVFVFLCCRCRSTVAELIILQVSYYTSIIYCSFLSVPYFIRKVSLLIPTALLPPVWTARCVGNVKRSGTTRSENGLFNKIMVVCFGTCRDRSLKMFETNTVNCKC